MNIIVKQTNHLTDKEWIDYVHSFNSVFGKKYDKNYFYQKYFKTIDNNSYHSLLYDSETIVGSCSVIPQPYIAFNKKIKVGLAVDVYILERYRTDPFLLYKMYNKLKQLLITNGVQIVIAVPNDTVYSYWKTIVKWKDIGTLNYYTYPFRAGNVIKKYIKVSNFFSKYLCNITLRLSALFYVHEKESAIRIDKSQKIIEEQRYHSSHILIENENTFFSYRIVLEEDIQTCYLIDFYNKTTLLKDSTSLIEAITYIKSNHQFDHIVYIGKIPFFQLSLIKVPYKLEPRHLNLTIDFLSHFEEKVSYTLLRKSNWDFGLFNYDVR